MYLGLQEVLRQYVIWVCRINISFVAFVLVRYRADDSFSVVVVLKKHCINLYGHRHLDVLPLSCLIVIYDGFGFIGFVFHFYILMFCDLGHLISFILLNVI
jgi:hypothetical protein